VEQVELLAGQILPYAEHLGIIQFLMLQLPQAAVAAALALIRHKLLVAQVDQVAVAVVKMVERFLQVVLVILPQHLQVKEIMVAQELIMVLVLLA
jgi:hypothetical protein